jgi:hypothetical protein
MWWAVGAAVHGRWRGELGEAFTGRKYCCCSLRGVGMKSRVRTGGVGIRAFWYIFGELLFEVGRWAGWTPRRGVRGCFSKSEQ